MFSPFKASRCIKASFFIPEIIRNFPTTKGFRIKISMKLVYQYMAIFNNFSPTSNHLYPLQVENCDSNSWLLVDEDNNGKFRLKGLTLFLPITKIVHFIMFKLLADSFTAVRNEMTV